MWLCFLSTRPCGVYLILIFNGPPSADMGGRLTAEKRRGRQALGSAEGDLLAGRKSWQSSGRASGHWHSRVSIASETTVFFELPATPAILGMGAPFPKPTAAKWRIGHTT